MNSFNRKILIIGIDGGTWKVLDDVIEKGYMPYLQNLKENGSYGTLQSTIPPISPSAWGTIQTGIDPLNNHVYEFYSFNKNTKEVKIVNSKFLKNTIWDILSNVGKKVAAVNIPMTYPPKKVNGYIISGILTPSIESDFVYPPELKQTILEKVPGYQLKYIEEKRYGNPIVNMENFINQRIKNLKDRTKVCLYLIHNYNIDILMVNFQANDILQHSLWGYMNKEHDLYDEKIQNYIYKNFHKILDLCIESIIEEFKRLLPGELLTMIISDHGFESHYKQFYLGDWLFQNNLIKLKKSSIKAIVRRKVRELIEKLRFEQFQVKFLKFLKNQEKKFKKILSEDSRAKKIRNIIDLEKSKVYPSGIGLYGYIFIFSEGDKRKKYIEILKKKLYNIEDRETGLKIVKKIFIKDEFYYGNHPELIPDLIIQPCDGYSFTGMYKGKKNLLERITIKESETLGKHNEEGIIIINSPSVLNKKIDEVSLKDIVPTILYYFNLPKMKEIDGKAIDCFKTEN